MVMNEEEEKCKTIKKATRPSTFDFISFFLFPIDLRCMLCICAHELRFQFHIISKNKIIHRELSTDKQEKLANEQGKRKKN